MRIKVGPLDALASRAVKYRDGWQCRRCLKKYTPESAKQSLHCAHIMSRRHRSTRWLLENMLTLCFGCHKWFDENRHDSVEWLDKEIGAEEVSRLRLLAHSTLYKSIPWKIYLEKALETFKAEYEKAMAEEEARP